MVRYKNRYALCEIIFPDLKLAPSNVTSFQVYSAIKNALLDNHGDFGLASLQFSLSVKYLNTDTHIVILRGARTFFHLLASAIVFVRNIGHHNAFLKSLHVGGTIRSCQKFLIRYHKANMTRLFPQCKTQEEKEQVMQSIMEACDSLTSLGAKAASSTVTEPTSTALSILQSGAVD